MFEVKVFSSGIDVAAFRPAAQSSMLRKFDAHNAVDGKPLSFSHTDVKNQVDKGVVWWQVDLGNEFMIDSVKIENRWCQDSSDPNGCLCRLSSGTILLVDSDGTSTTSKSLGNTCGQSYLSSDFGNLSICFHNVSAVKIESTTNRSINLFEVKVFSVNMDNLAVEGNATQSSTYQGLSKFEASRAIDGSTATFSHTQGDNAWWQVDLGATHHVAHVEITNRWCRNPSDPTGCLCRLSNAMISLLDHNRSIVAAEHVGDTCGARSLKVNICDMIAA